MWHQASLIAAMEFQGTKLPLTTWFLAIYLISQAKTGLSALALKRQLGVSYPTAWLIHHKLMQVMAEHEERYVLEGSFGAVAYWKSILNSSPQPSVALLP